MTFRPAWRRPISVIARSGASTIAELLALARPALLVPYPHAADDHQTANARALAEAGAAVLVAQRDLTAERLAAELDGADGRARAAAGDGRLRGRAPASRRGRAAGGRHSRLGGPGDAAVSQMPLDVGPIHFVGIGGIGMSGIAEILHNLGYRVQGSDLGESANVQRLRGLGIPVAIGHAARNLGDALVVVVSTAVKAGNPEVDLARARRVPVVRRADMLGELMRLKRSIAVAGTHGKTTTTAIVAALLDAAGLDPTVVNGGIINAYGTNARLGKGDWMVVESDESDGSFLRLPATIGVVTNIDPEHMDYWGSFDAVRQAYYSFIERLPFYGFGVLCIDHPEVQALLARITDRRVVTYGFSPQADVRATSLRFQNGGELFDVAVRDRASGGTRLLEGVKLGLLGRHNVSNALAAVAIAGEIGIADATLREALAGLQGVKRRFTKTGVVAGITVIDDYGHHPEEIRAVLRTARAAAPRPRRRRRPAAPLHAAPGPARGVLHLLRRRRHGGRGAGLRRRRAADRRHRPRGSGARPARSWPA